MRSEKEDEETSLGLVYTANFGDYDSPEFVGNYPVEDKFDYLYFSDKSVTLPKPWVLKVVRPIHNNVSMNRLIKFCIHQFTKNNYTHCIYVDSNVQIRTSLRNFTAPLNHGHRAVFFEHPSRRTVFEEIIECIICNRISFREGKRHLVKLKSLHYADVNLLTNNRVFSRVLTDPELNAAFEDIFESFSRGPARDQLHTQPILSRHKIGYALLPRECILNYLFIFPHKKIPAGYRLKVLFRRLFMGFGIEIIMRVSIYKINARKLVD